MTNRQGRRPSPGWRALQQAATPTEAHAAMKMMWQESQPSADYRLTKRAGKFRSHELGKHASGVDADCHTNGDPGYFRMVEYARHLEMNAPLVGPCMDRLTTNVFRRGLQCHPTSGHKEFDRESRRRWHNWARSRDCERARRHKFPALEKIVFRRTVVDGDHFTIIRSDSDRMQCLENHRARTPGNIERNKQRRNAVTHGAETRASTGEILNWYFTKSNAGPTRNFQKVEDFIKIPSRNEDDTLRVLQTLLYCERSTATRGISKFNRFGDNAGQLDDVLFAWLVKEQVASCITFFKEREHDFTGDGANDAVDEKRWKDLNSYIGDEVPLQPGMFLKGAPGEKIQGFSPNVAGSNSMEHAMLHVCIMSVNLGVPVICLLLDATQTNFSGWKGALQQAEQGWDRLAFDFAETWHADLYEWRQRRELATDEEFESLAQRAAEETAAAGNEFRPYGCEWRRQVPDSIQPVEQATAARIRIADSTSSLQTISREQHGRDWDEVYPEVIDNKADAIQAAKERARLLNADLEDGESRVDWRDLIGFPTADGVKISLQVGGDADSSGNGDGDGANSANQPANRGAAQ